MIRLIVSDLDGTLLDEPNSISKINLDAIEYAYEKGARFCFATGRDLASVEDICRLLKHRPLLILGNGAVIYDEQGRIVEEDFFPNQYLKAVTDILNHHDVPHMIFTTDGVYTTTGPAMVRERFIERITAISYPENAIIYATDKNKPCNNLVLITDMPDFIKTKKIIKVEGFHLESGPVEAVKGELEQYTGISYLSTGKNNVEITNITAQKGLVLKKYIKKIGIEEDEVMVLGDSHNDLSMFEHFKYSFAPANSCDEIKEKAYRVVASCREHGVSEAIYELLGET